MAKTIKRIEHSKTKKKLECFLCHKIFSSTVGNLRRHIKLHAPIVENFQCLRCLKCFQTRGNYTLHWKTNHLNISSIAEKPLKIVAKAKREYFLKVIYLDRTSLFTENPF